jgi:hypothetical protein
MLFLGLALSAAVALLAIKRWFVVAVTLEEHRMFARRIGPTEPLRRGDLVVYEAHDHAFHVRRVAALEGDPVPRWNTAIELVPRGRVAVGGDHQRPAFIARSAVVARVRAPLRGRAGGPSAAPSGRGRRSRTRLQP